MVVLKIIPGEIITSDGFFELLRETSQETRLNWTKYIEARLSKWEELMPILNPSLPNIVFTASNSNRKLTIEPSRVPYDRYQPRSQYPVRFRIPPTTLSGLSQRDCVIRAMRFALGSLIFMIMTGTPPFEELDDDAVEKEYKRGHYPGDVIYLQERIMVEVLQYWSREFGEAWLRISGSKISTIAKGVAGAGAATCVGAALVVPALGIVGFSAAGPVAGSIAAGLQSSLGSAAAGGVFAWCQSAVMGGYAAAGLATLQGVGLTTAMASSVVGHANARPEGSREAWDLFNEVVRKGANEVEPEVGGEESTEEDPDEDTTEENIPSDEGA